MRIQTVKKNYESSLVFVNKTRISESVETKYFPSTYPIYQKDQKSRDKADLSENRFLNF